jgi:hypothetical protein
VSLEKVCEELRSLPPEKLEVVAVELLDAEEVDAYVNRPLGNAG